MAVKKKKSVSKAKPKRSVRRVRPKVKLGAFSLRGSGKFVVDPGKVNKVVKNLIMFVVLFVFSFLLYSVSVNELYVNLFLMLSIVLGFVALAFLIILLSFIFMRIFRK